MKKVLNIFGDITHQPQQKTDVSVQMVLSEITGLNKGDELEVNINSYGGEVFEAVAIRGVIHDSPAIKTFGILGICASAATSLFYADDKVIIAKGAMVMYHKMKVNVFGDSASLRKTAKQLDKMENEIILPDLSLRSGKKTDELLMLLAEEWWLSSDEAIQNLGFLDAGINSIINKAETKQVDIYKNYIERKKALSNNAHDRFINHLNFLKK